MKKDKASRHYAYVIIAIITIIGCDYGFNYWLRYYSSIYVVGLAEKTHERSPEWSPDGKYIAYLCGFSYPSDGWDIRSWNNPGWGLRTSEICIIELDTRQIRQITRFGRDKYGLKWSPNGNYLLWIDGRKNLISIYDFENGKTLVNINRDTYDCLPIFWSQDSQRLLSSCGNFTLELPTMKISKSPSTTETTDMLLSPNEEYLAHLKEFSFTGDVPLPALQKYHEIFGANSNPYLMTIIQNGVSIYKSDYWVINHDHPHPFEWSPDGDILVFRKYVEDFEEPDIVFLYAPTGETALFESDEFYSLYWSPNGNKIACKTNEDTLEIVEFEFRINPFSYIVTNRQSLSLNKSSEGDRFGEDLVWSPDEKHIAYSYYQFKENFNEAIISFPPKIWLVNLETGTQTPLVVEP